MYRSNALKERFRAGGHAYGAWVNSCSPIVVELMALAGYDCLMIDREHSPGDLLNAVNLLNAIRTTPTTALMRVPGHDPVELKRVLDIGVEGVMVPAVSSASEARAVVAACRYPPEGFRGIAIGVARAADYGFQSEAYKRNAFANLLLIVQIETVAAVEVVEEIAAVDGVDMLFIGPRDMSAALGKLNKMDDPELRALIAKVEQATFASGKALGTVAPTAALVKELFGRGYTFLIAGSDLSHMRAGIAQMMKDAGHK